MTSVKSGDYKLKLIIKGGILLILICTFIVAGCTENTADINRLSDSDLLGNSSIERVELYHFSTNSQCYSCVLVGELANETVHTYYQPELDSGALVFDHINID